MTKDLGYGVIDFVNSGSGDFVWEDKVKIW